MQNKYIIAIIVSVVLITLGLILIILWLRRKFIQNRDKKAESFKLTQVINQNFIKAPTNFDLQNVAQQVATSPSRPGYYSIINQRVGKTNFLTYKLNSKGEYDSTYKLDLGETFKSFCGVGPNSFIVVSRLSAKSVYRLYKSTDNLLLGKSPETVNVNDFPGGTIGDNLQPYWGTDRFWIASNLTDKNTKVQLYGIFDDIKTVSIDTGGLLDPTPVAFQCNDTYAVVVVSSNNDIYYLFLTYNNKTWEKTKQGKLTTGYQFANVSLGKTRDEEVEVAMTVMNDNSKNTIIYYSKNFEDPQQILQGKSYDGVGIGFVGPSRLAYSIDSQPVVMKLYDTINKGDLMDLDVILQNIDSLANADVRFSVAGVDGNRIITGIPTQGSVKTDKTQAQNVLTYSSN